MNFMPLTISLCLRRLGSVLPFVLLLPLSIQAQRSASGELGRGTRVLSMDLTEPASNDFGQVIATAKSAGVHATSLTLFWDELETAPGIFQPAVNYLAIADAFYPAQGFGLSLELNPIDTTQLRLPADLVGRGFGDPLVLSRFKALLDWVLTQVPNLDLISLGLGNEVDIFLGTDLQAWSRFETFFAGASSYARSLFPNVPVGAKVTYQGIIGPSASCVRSLQGFADALFMTYYPLRSDFTVRPLLAVRRDLRRVLRMYPSRSIYLLEAGFPAGALCQSSEDLQACFVHELFAIWDRYAERIPVINFVWMHEISPADAAAFGVYYGISDPVFLEFLGTLGMRTFDGDGTDKAAFQQLRNEAQLRGW